MVIWDKPVEHFGDSFVCPICKGNASRPVVLMDCVNSTGAQRKQVQVHVACLKLKLIDDGYATKIEQHVGW